MANNDNNERRGTQKAPTLPPLKDMPLILKHLMTISPRQMREAMFHTVSVALCCIATRVRTYYTFDSYLHALLLRELVEAEQSGGKSFVREYVDGILMRSLKERDADGRRKEQEYRELKQRAAKNKTLPEAPKTVIRITPPAISIAMLVKRADAPQRYYGTPITLWSFTEELSTIVESNKRAFANIRSIERTSYDLGSTWGNDYLSEQAYSATVDILQCALYLGTPNAINAYADNAFIEGGGVTRTIFIKLPGSLGDEAPEFKPLTAEMKDEINKMLSRMDEDVYENDGTIKPERIIDMSWLNKTVRRWCEEQRNEVLMTGSLAHDTFYKRSSVSAFRETTLCAYLYQIEGVGEKEIQRRCKQIYLYAANYILKSMLSRWGDRFEAMARKRMQGDSKVRVPVFNQLTSPFTRQQLDEIVKRNELTTPTKVFISKWKGKGWIDQTGNDTFTKLCTPHD